LENCSTLITIAWMWVSVILLLNCCLWENAFVIAEKQGLHWLDCQLLLNILTFLEFGLEKFPENKAWNNFF